MKSGCKLGLAADPVKGLVALSCKGTKMDLLAYFAMASACPPLCKAGVVNTHKWGMDGLITLADGCLSRDTLAVFKHQITGVSRIRSLGSVLKSKDTFNSKLACSSVKNVATGLGYI